MIKLRKSLLFILDITILWISLVLTLFIRYGNGDFKMAFSNHMLVFIAIFIIWLSVFEFAGLYQLKIFKGVGTLLSKLILASFISFLISIIFLYIFDPLSRVTPKINLLFFSIIFLILNYLGRIVLNQLSFSKQKVRVLFLGEPPLIAELISDLKSTPQFGYEAIGIIKEENMSKEKLNPFLLKKMAEMIVISPAFKQKTELAKLIYYFLPLNIEVVDFRDFYEIIYQKEPLEILDETWFIEKLRFRPLYDTFKRVFDFSLALLSSICFSPIFLLCMFLVKISSQGPIFFKQKVLGKNNKIFTLYKLRTMKNGADYPLWTVPGDKRITKVGNFLRNSHLDELPQLYNIMKGEISFAGPRPERVELAEIFEKRLPYYNYRNAIKPGFTGWAQINYKPSASVEEAAEKLKYDFYYLKNRSFLLDLLIIFKNIKLFIVSPQ